MTKEELEKLKLRAEVKNLIASRAKFIAERRNLLSPVEARGLQMIQPFLGGSAVVASLLVALVTWWSKSVEISNAKKELAQTEQELVQVKTLTNSALLVESDAERKQGEAEKRQHDAEQKQHDAEQKEHDADEKTREADAQYKQDEQKRDMASETRSELLRVSLMGFLERLLAIKDESQPNETITSLAKEIKQVIPPAPFPPNTWFVYLTTDRDDDRKDVTFKVAKTTLAKLPPSLSDIPVRIYARIDETRYAVGLGDPLSEEDAKKLVNRVYRAGFTDVARNSTTGWKLVPWQP